LQCVAVCCSAPQCVACRSRDCTTLQHTATQCNTLQRTVPRCHTLLHTATRCNTLQHTATHCNTLLNAANTEPWILHYEVATISRMLKNIGLFCKRALQKRPVFCKETCIFKHPTHRSHPIATPSRLNHAATHCNTLQHTATHSSTLSFARGERMLNWIDGDPQHTATCCNILHHLATHCNTLKVDRT